MMGGTPPIGVALGALVLACASATAEVRLRPVGPGRPAPDVRVLMNSPLVWSAVGAADSYTLNPSGDMHGDGRPAVARTSSDVLVAWFRPGVGVVAARGHRAWAPVVVVEPGTASGDPLLTACGSGWLLVTSDPASRDTSLRVMSQTGSVSERRLVADFRPLTVTSSDVDGALLVGLTSSGDIAVITVPSVSVPPTDPWEVPAVHGPIVVERLPGGVMASLPSEPWGVPALLDAQFHSGTQADGDAFTLLTWWVSPYDLHAVQVTPEGPMLPASIARVRGGATYSPSLVQQAIHDARQK